MSLDLLCLFYSFSHRATDCYHRNSLVIVVCLLYTYREYLIFFCFEISQINTNTMSANSMSSVLEESGLNSWRQSIRIRPACLLISPEPSQSQWVNRAVQQCGECLQNQCSYHGPRPNSPISFINATPALHWQNSECCKEVVHYIQS